MLLNMVDAYEFYAALGDGERCAQKFHVLPHLRDGVVHLAVARGPSGGEGGRSRKGERGTASLYKCNLKFL